MNDLMNPSFNLTVTQKENEVELNDEQDRKRALFTDGRKLQSSNSDTYKETAARWDGDRLVATEDGPHKGKIERILAYSDGGSVLIETFRLLDSKSNPTVVVRYVFDRDMRAAQPQPAAKQ